MVEEQGRKGQPLGEAENELVKFLRRYPLKNGSSLRIKYGKNWRAKFEELAGEGIVGLGEEQVRVLTKEALLI